MGKSIYNYFLVASFCKCSVPTTLQELISVVQIAALAARDPSCDFQFTVISTNQNILSTCSGHVSDLFIAANYTGPLSLPSIISASQISFNGDDKNTMATMLDNLTSLDFPNLVNVTGLGIFMSHLHGLTSLSVPMLRDVEDNMILDFTGNGVSELTFPSLEGVRNFNVSGNIDS